VETALSDLRVVELGGGVAAGFCGRLLAAFGATVLKIEPPGGDPLRRYGPFPAGSADPEESGLFLHLNEAKLGATLDPVVAADRREIGRLCAMADLLVESLPPAEDWIDGLSRALPGLVIVSITASRSMRSACWTARR
jgi:crotonobetainyl-CoA:carnitine CoA-transferase CaiB-like acyl-CoA transferase